MNHIADMLILPSANERFQAALSVVAKHLHSTWAFDHFEGGEISKQSCVLASLTVKDFLFKCGFHDAKVTPVFTIMIARLHGKQIHSLGIGKPDEKPLSKGSWPGHMVVEIPSQNVIVDTTLYPAMRPHWPALPGMICTTINGDGSIMYDYPILTGIGLSKDESGYDFSVWWLRTEHNTSWKKAPDAINLRRRRKQVVEKLFHHFKQTPHR